ncbi:reverse transcriptase-like protein [Peribacillus sp. SCS-155]|uniref:reverse transcriptase-like protein n=1 Tax=Peribacillus sedimenti TaxID=3115297 RepID=UPI00390590B7
MKVLILWTYGGSKRPEAAFTSDFIQAEKALLIADDLEKTGRLKNIEFKDEVGTTWNKKELKKLLTKIEEEPQDVTVYFDGGYQKENGRTGIGIVIYYRQGKKEWRVRKNLSLSEILSNNEAEYAACYEAVNQLQELGVHHQKVRIKGDSQVVLNQLSGEWPCFEEELNRWLDRIEAKIEQLGIIPEYEHVPRKENHEADKLATQALNGESITSALLLTEEEGDK